MQVTDLTGTEIQLHPGNNPNPHCQILLDGIENGTILLLLAIETTEGRR